MKHKKKTYQSGGGIQRGQAVGGGIGTGAGAAIGTFLLPGVGTKLGATIGGGIGRAVGGLFGSRREKEPEPPATIGQIFQSSYGFQEGGRIRPDPLFAGTMAPAGATLGGLGLVAATPGTAGDASRYGDDNLLHTAASRYKHLDEYGQLRSFQKDLNQKALEGRLFETDPKATTTRASSPEMMERFTTRKKGGNLRPEKAVSTHVHPSHLDKAENFRQIPLPGEVLKDRHDHTGNRLSYRASGSWRRDAEHFGPLGDLYRYFAGDPLKYNVLKASEYQPTISKDSDKSNFYVSIDDKEFKKDILDAHRRIFKERDLREGEFQVNDQTFGADLYSSNRPASALGRLFISEGKDEKGRYVSYYDVFNTRGNIDNKDIGQRLGATKPFEVYGRIYLDEKGNADPEATTTKSGSPETAEKFTTRKKGGSIMNTRNKALDGALSLPGVGSIRLAEGGGVPHMEVGGRHHEAGGVSLEAFGRPEIEVERDEVTTFDAFGEPDYVFSNLRMQDKPRTFSQEFQRLSEKGDLAGIRNLKRKQEEAMGRKINVTMDSSLRKAQMAKYGGSLKSTGGSLQSEEGFSASRSAAKYGGKLQKRSGGALSPFKQEGGSLNRLWGDIRRTFGGPENRPISERPRFQAAQQRAGQAPRVVGQRTIYTPPQGAAGAAPGYSPPGTRSMVHVPQAPAGAASRFGSFLRNPATWKAPGTWNLVGIGAMAGYYGPSALMGETPFEAKDRWEEARAARDRAMFNRQQQDFRRGLEDPEGILSGSPFYTQHGAEATGNPVADPLVDDAPVATASPGASINTPEFRQPGALRTELSRPGSSAMTREGAMAPEAVDVGDGALQSAVGHAADSTQSGSGWETVAGVLPYAADLFNMGLAARARRPQRVRAPMPVRMDTRVPTAAAEEAATRGARGITADPAATSAQRLAATAGLHQARGQVRAEADRMSRGIETQNVYALNRAREIGYQGERAHQEALQQHEGAKMSVYSQGVRSMSDRLERRAFEKRAQELMPFQITALVHSLPTEQRRALIDDLLGSLPPGHHLRAQLEALSKRGT